MTTGADPRPSRGPIFIVGNMRTGTTLLRLMLDAHPDIAIGPESGFMRVLEGAKNIEGWYSGEHWYQRFGFDEAEYEQQLAEMFRRFFSEFARRSGKSRWGEKTPFHLYHVLKLADLFPDSRFIGMVRHPGAVATSLRRWNYDFANSLRSWGTAARLLEAQQQTLGPDRMLIVRYEDLVLNDRGTLELILKHVDEPWSEDVLNYHEVQREREAGPVVTDGGTRVTDAIDGDRLNRWTSETTPEERALITAMLADHMAMYGYVADTAVPEDIRSL